MGCDVFKKRRGLSRKLNKLQEARAEKRREKKAPKAYLRGPSSLTTSVMHGTRREKKGRKRPEEKWLLKRMAAADRGHFCRKTNQFFDREVERKEIYVYVCCLAKLLSEAEKQGIYKNVEKREFCEGTNIGVVTFKRL